MHLFLVASRYLLARPISFVAILVFIVAVVAVVLVDSIMNGFLREHRTMARGTSPDVSIDLDKELRRDEDALVRIMDCVRSTEGVTAAGLRRSWPVLYRHQGIRGAAVDGRAGTEHFVELMGMDLEAGGEIDELRALVAPPIRDVYADALRRRSAFAVEPEAKLRPPRLDDPLWFDPDDDFWRSRVDPDFIDTPLIPVLFGEELAYKMVLNVGQVVDVRGLGDPDDEGYYPKRKKFFVVVGSYRSEDALFEQTTAVTTRAGVLNFCGTAELAEEVSISTESASVDRAVQSRLQARLAALDLGASAVGPEDVLTWEERQAVLLGAVQNERVILNFVLLIVVGIAGFSLLVTLSMMVNTKVREIGVLVSMGSSSRDIVALFLLCGVMVSLVGMAIGLALGLWLCSNVNGLLEFFRVELFDQDFYSFVRLPTEIDVWRLAGLMAATFGTGLLASVVPSLRAGRMEAVEALRQG